MGLDDLRTSYDRLRAELEGTRFEVTWQAPTANHPKQSACLSLEGPDRLGALIVWASGEAQLQLAAVASGEVTDEVLELADADQLAWAVTRLKAWVMGRDTGEEREA
ncbi:hypothetical protein [Streptomyces justiciae]|uniref:hypothetical protein n=1 Tax=Streptomyces justiciae TaxID=2780140 RepID=UPI0018826A5D|nr:hypothetical protein [Streptomyces justiciae]MBE8477824.1 hypothetical protein [Streptomyces justiciae]